MCGHSSLLMHMSSLSTHKY